MKNQVHSHTPSVTVIDNRRLAIRQIDYHRLPDKPDETDEQITHHFFTVAGFPSQSLSPRQFDLQQKNPSLMPNRQTIYSLSGESLQTDSTDEGTHLILKDIAQRPHFSLNANSVKRWWQYEAETLPGRELSITEQAPAEAVRITERFIWAGNSQNEKNDNLSGICRHHYHTAGKDTIERIAITGALLQEARQLIVNELEVDWRDGDDSLLSDEILTTMFTSNAVGTVLTQADTFGHIRRYRYDIAGQLIAGWLTLKGQREQVVTQSIDYNAAGLIVHEVAGNGVVTTYDYEPETQRLIGIKTARPTGHSSGAAILQDLRYSFDPVGNVIRIRNDAEATRFWRNQKIVPEQTFVYDSLYQLASATGREMANLSQQINTFPSPSPIDDNTYTQYTRSYVYDRDGNLCRIRHSAPTSGNQYTRDITVSSGSNRAILSSFTDNPDEVEKLFDRAGHQLQLLPGQTLNWNGRGELQQVTPVMRNTDSDREFYLYDAGGQRVLKETRWLTGNTQHVSRKVYLAGVERMQTYQDNMLRESYQRIQVQNVQVLHWEEGLPVGLNNDSVRYNHSDLIGNNLLETDKDGLLISREEMYPFGETAIWAARSQVEAFYKVYRYSGKERDATGLYYYGFRYYQPWLGRWLSADPAGPVDGLNQYWMVRNNPLKFIDDDGLAPTEPELGAYEYETNWSTSFKLAVAKKKSNILAFDSEKNRYVPSDNFKLVRLNDGKRNGYQFNKEELQRKIDEFVNGYIAADRALSGESNSSRRTNIETGVDISQFLKNDYEYMMSNGDALERKSFPSLFKRIFKKNTLPETISNTEYFALINKNDKKKRDGTREIYAIAKATVTNHTMNNLTELTYDYLVANPKTQVNPDIYALSGEDNIKTDSTYSLKGIGGYSTIHSIAKLYKKYKPNKILIDAGNVRSAAIAQKFGAVKVRQPSFSMPIQGYSSYGFDI